MMYLGRALGMTEMHDEQLRNRVAKAWSKFSIYRGELVEKNFPIRCRMRLFNASVTPTILYGSGSWAMTSER